LSAKPARRRNIAPRGKYFLCGIAFLLTRISILALLVIVGFVFYQQGEGSEKLIIGVVASASTLIISGLIIIANQRKVACPLCRASLFMSPKALGKPAGKKLFGSAKARLAFSVLTFPDVLECPYCAERVRLTRSTE